MDGQRCEVCDRVVATDADHDAMSEGAGEGLCWRAWDSRQCEASRVDWRARAMAATGERNEALAEADDLRRERDEARAETAAIIARRSEEREAERRERESAHAARLAALAEVERLRAELAQAREIIEGSTKAPTQRESEAHFAVGGVWLAIRDERTAVSKWWAVDRNCRLCARPVVSDEVET